MTSEQGDQETCLVSRTPTRLTLLSPAVGSRQCKASTGLGRGPHVSSFLHMHLPISPLPSSFLSLSFRHSFTSLFPSFLTIHLPHPFLLFFLFLKICSFHIPSTNLHWRSKTNSSQPQEAVHGKTGLHQQRRGWGATCAAPVTPSNLTSLALCSQHTPQASPHLLPSWHWCLTQADESREEAVSKASTA